MTFRQLILPIAFSLAACTPTVLHKPESDINQSTQLKKAVEQIIAENQAACNRQEYNAIYLKSACKVSDISSEQLSDSSRISTSEKSLFQKFQSGNQVQIAKAASAYRAYGGRQGEDGALILERAAKLFERNANDLYEGTISWGEYNKRRQEIQQSYVDEFSKAYGQN
jgi:hypothetical protein